MSRRVSSVALVVAALLPGIGLARAEDVPKTGPIVLYVAPGGNDAWTGKLAAPNAEKTDGPLATIQRARDELRKLKAAGGLKGPVVVQVRGGTYRLAEPIVFTAADSGTREAPITYAAAPGEQPVFSGGMPIAGWTKDAAGPAWTAAVPDVRNGKAYFRSLFVDGRRAVPARSPNEGQVHEMAGPLEPLKNREAARRDPKTRLGFRFEGEHLKRWADMDDAVLVVYHAWTTSRSGIESVDPAKHEVRVRNPSGWPFGWWGKERFYVENVREALDAPGEFYLDRKTGRLSYCPRPGEDMAKAEAIAPRLEEVLRLDGDPAAGKLVEHLRFEGLSFRHTDWTMPRSGAVDGQAAAFLKTATVFARGARHCTFQQCEIAQTGGYGLWLERGSKDCRVVQCHLHDLGAGGVRLGEMGLPAKPEEQAERNEVHNCFIHDGGHVFHAGIGVWVGRTSHNKVQHNDICDFLYSGVSVGWSWGYAPTSAQHNLIEYNHIHHLGWGQLSDLGGIYTLGVSPGTRLRYNLIHDVLSYDYGGWGLYTDEGSTEILMENNIVYRVKDGAFHQHYGKENVVRNNVLALSATLGQVRRSRQEEHSSFTLEKNVIYGRGVPMLGGNWSNGRYKLDENCYYDASGQPPKFPGNLSFKDWQAKGQDVRSIVADPKFVDASKCDFRLLPDSPALKLGFQPIDVSQIGLVGPADWVALPKQVQRPAMKMPGE
jgi:hypothetical protein